MRFRANRSLDSRCFRVGLSLIFLIADSKRCLSFIPDLSSARRNVISSAAIVNDTATPFSQPSMLR